MVHILKNSYLIFTLVVLTIFMILVQVSRRDYKPRIFLGRNKTITAYPRTSIQCFRMKGETLPDMSEGRPPEGRSIFFHETSCQSHSNGKISITAREGCSVESALKTNPNLEVYLLFTSPGTIRFEGTESDRFLRALLTYRNLKVRHLDFEKYTKGTLVEELYSQGKIEKSRYPLSHASDVLRYLTLWKYGGIYLDLDILVLKSLESLRPNFAAAQLPWEVASAVMGFSPNGTGHELAESCLNDLRNNFNGDIWAHNGPGVITRLVQRTCRLRGIQKVANRDCGGLKVFSEQSFYPIPYWDWNLFFKENVGPKVLEKCKNSYGVHLWNKLSASKKVRVKGNSTYAILAREVCPKIVKECGEFI